MYLFKLCWFLVVFLPAFVCLADDIRPLKYQAAATIVEDVFQKFSRKEEIDAYLKQRRVVGDLLDLVNDEAYNIYFDVESGNLHSCGLYQGIAFCWGRGDDGQLGHGKNENTSIPQRVLGYQRYVQLAAGDKFTCGLTSDHLIYCWGLIQEVYLPDEDGRFNFNFNFKRVNRPTLVFGSPNFQFQKIKAYGENICAITQLGIIACWGSGTLGQSSIGIQNFQDLTAHLHRFKDFAIGENHACGIHDNDTVSCMGDPSFGVLADGQDGRQNAFLDFTLTRGGYRFRSVVLGKSTSCGITLENQLFCWGKVYLIPHDEEGESTPVSVSEVYGDMQFKSVSIGNDQICALSMTGQTYCWGNLSYGQSVRTAKSNWVDDPHLIEIQKPFKKISVGEISVCGQTEDDHIFCWGWGRFGGDSDPTRELSSSFPTQVAHRDWFSLAEKKPVLNLPFMLSPKVEFPTKLNLLRKKRELIRSSPSRERLANKERLAKYEDSTEKESVKKSRDFLKRTNPGLPFGTGLEKKSRISAVPSQSDLTAADDAAEMN